MRASKQVTDGMEPGYMSGFFVEMVVVVVVVVVSMLVVVGGGGLAVYAKRYRTVLLPWFPQCKASCTTTATMAVCLRGRNHSAG